MSSGKQPKHNDHENSTGEGDSTKPVAKSSSEHQPTTTNVQDISQQLAKFALTKSAPRTLEEGEKKEYQFWSTQPVPKLNDDIQVNEAIEPDKPISEIRAEPYSLPEGFYWDTLDLDNEAQLKEVYTLLSENYVEDDDNMFRFDYSPAFLQWAIQPPGWLKEWHVGVRGGKNHKLFCFISAVPCTMRIHDREMRLVEINFLCVHKRLRNRRVAPVLIREITRRVNLTGIFQAVYTAGVMLPKPITTCRYWHRSLNPKKLIESRFSSLTRNMTMQRTIKLYKLPDQTLTPGFQPLQEKHCSQAFQLLFEYLSKFKVCPVFNVEEFKYWFLPREDVIYSYVVEVNGEVTDFCSFYALPSSVIQHPVHKTLRAAYSFYNVAKAHSWSQLMKDALIEAKNRHFDVFNALDLMDNKSFLEELKFGIGDGNLHYYVYNWRCPGVKPEEIALVLQ